MSYERIRTKEDMLEELELHSIVPGLVYHDSSSLNTDSSLPIDFRRLSIPASGHQYPGTLQDDVADFFQQLTYHDVSVEKLCATFGISADHGLDHVVAARNIQRDGKNTIAEKKPTYLWKLVGYFFGGFCPILWVAVIICFICWHLSNLSSPTYLALAILIIIIIMLQASFFAFQDWSTSRIMNSIFNLIPSECVVIREGETSRIPAANLAVGDVVLLSAGNKVPADVRLIVTSEDVRFDRAMLTGESEEVEGNVDSLGVTFLEAPNIAFMGTHITNGRAKGVVVLTGGRTVMGRMSKFTNGTTIKGPTLLQQEIWRFVRINIFLTLSLAFSIVIAWLAWLHPHHNGFLSASQMLSEVMGCIVAFFPEGLPIAFTLVLSLVARRMKDISVLPKSLSTVETLGCVTVTCSNITGALTQNKMSVMSAGFVDKTYTAQQFRENFTKDLSAVESATQQLHRAAVLCNGATFDAATNHLPLDERDINGDATDGAILRFAESVGDAPAVRASKPEIYQVPFKSRNKWMLTMHNSSSSEDPKKKTTKIIFVKGAPDVLIPRCTSYCSALTDDIQPLDSVARAKLIDTQEKWSRDGQRVILLCMREYIPYHTVGTNNFSIEIRQQGVEALTIVGILGLMDPLRPESAATVKDSRKAGIRCFMVTGDFGLTATAIARQVGIITTHAEPDSVADVVRQMRHMPISLLPSCRDPANWVQKSLLLEGKDLNLFTEGHWYIATRYEEIVFARTTPEQKLGIVTALQKRDNVVAFIGCGVDDAPALKAADIGIAVVKVGSDVAIEAADLVLLGKFDSLVSGIRLGRLVFQNLQKVITYLLPAGSWSTIWPIITNVYFGVPLPLSPFLMIMICLITDLLPCLLLALEDEEFDLLTIPPRNRKKDHLINLKIYIHAYLFIGMLETIIAHALFFSFYWSYTGISIGDLFLSFGQYNDPNGFHGHTAAELVYFHKAAQCLYFFALVFMQLTNLYSVRYKRISNFQGEPNKPDWFFPVVTLSGLIVIFVTELSTQIQQLFATVPVPGLVSVLVVPLALGTLLIDEARKLLVRRYPKGFLARIAW